MPDDDAPDDLAGRAAWPAWFDNAAVMAAALAETAGALLFWNALRKFGGHGAGAREAWIALGWNILVWLGFIAGTEFFVAYQAEGPFRELLAISLLMAIVVAVVPDDAGLPTRPPQAEGNR
jgi:hypothetical protein